MKKILFFLPIILIVFSCKDDCSPTKIPQENIEEMMKVMYDSEWGGMKEQLLDMLEIYECLTESSCTVPEEYMDTVLYTFNSGEINHEKKIKYHWELLPNGDPDITELKVNIELAKCSFENSDFSYDYTLIDVEVIIEDNAQEDYYRLDLDTDIVGDYTGFDRALNMGSDCGLLVNKSDHEIQPHLCSSSMNVYYTPCDYNETVYEAYDADYSIE